MTSAQKLLILWEQRDVLYKTRHLHGQRHPLSEDEAHGVRAHRLKEAMALPEKQRAVALAELDRWTAPEVIE